MHIMGVVFDTNAYRALSDSALIETRALEARHGIQPYASFWVAIELLAHIASPSDPKFGPARSSLKRLWNHCSRQDGDLETLLFLADSENQLCKAIFGTPIPGREKEAPIYGQLVGAVVHGQSPTDWAEYQPALDYLRGHVADIEKQFVEDMWQCVVLGIDPAAGSWRPLDGDPELRKRLAAAVKSELGMKLCASMVLLKAALELGLQLDTAELDEKIAFVMEVFATPLALYNEIVRRIIIDGCDLQTKNRANWIWDMQMAFQTSPAASLGDSPVWLITDDAAIIEAATEAGADSVVKSLADYRAFLAAL
jgi:hypothetical protein